ncbi:hypothetical protein K474DRAFT_1680960, partial [Panus rudis PR-1116 ss-1]
TFDELKVSQFQLSNGKLIALAEGGVPGNAGAPTPGSTVNFLISNTPGGSASFCAVPQGSSSILAVNGDTGSFQKCHATGRLNSRDQSLNAGGVDGSSTYIIDSARSPPTSFLLANETKTRTGEGKTGALRKGGGGLDDKGFQHSKRNSQAREIGHQGGHGLTECAQGIPHGCIKAV